MDLILVLVAFTGVFKDALEVTVVDHCHWSMTICIPTVSIELVDRILKPRVALLLQYISVHEYMVEDQTYLEQFQGIE